eukprot:1820256-Pyramimonas_sp.AAC.1
MHGSASTMSCPPSTPRVGTSWKCVPTPFGGAPGCSTPLPASAPSSSPAPSPVVALRYALCAAASL